MRSVDSNSPCPQEKRQIAVFFIDDNFANNVKRTKSLLRDIIAAKAQVHWVAQINANLLRDEGSGSFCMLQFPTCRLAVPSSQNRLVKR